MTVQQNETLEIEVTEDDIVAVLIDVGGKILIGIGTFAALIGIAVAINIFRGKPAFGKSFK